MIPTQAQLFSYTDLPLVAPWLTEKICLSLMAAGLFTPRLTQRAPDADVPHLGLYDLIALTSVQQLLRSGVKTDQLQNVLYAPSSFRCDDFYQEYIGFFSANQSTDKNSLCSWRRSPQTSRSWSGISWKEVPILSSFPTSVSVQDFRGVTLTGVECKTIRDAIKSNIDDWTTGKSVQSDGHESLQA